MANYTGRYKAVSYPLIVKQLIRMRKLRGSPIPLSRSISFIEDQTGLTLDKSRIKRALISVKHHDALHIQESDHIKVIDLIV
jgi:hypothetical protein